MNRKEKYYDLDEWETDVFRAGATQVLEVGENIFYAIRTPDNKPVHSDADGMFDLRSRRGREVMKTATTIGGWAGGSGEIYRHIIAKAGKARPYTNPMREDPLDAMYVEYLRPMKDEEPFVMGGTKYEFVRARYPDGRIDIGVYSTAGDLTYGYRHWRKMMNLDRATTNPKGIYTTFDGWRAAAKKAGATRFEGGRDDIAQAWDASGSWIGEWDGAEGFIRKSKENPVKPRRGESSRAFVSRCMSEEKQSFPAPKQRIAVCLSKSRRRNPVYDTGSDE